MRCVSVSWRRRKGETSGVHNYTQAIKCNLDMFSFKMTTASFPSSEQQQPSNVRNFRYLNDFFMQNHLFKCRFQDRFLSHLSICMLASGNKIKVNCSSTDIMRICANWRRQWILVLLFCKVLSNLIVLPSALNARRNDVAFFCLFDKILKFTAKDFR